MDLRLDLRLSQKLVMTPQLQQAIKLLQLSRLELQQVLAQHLVENPLLEDMALETQDEEAAVGEENPDRVKEPEGEGEASDDAAEVQPTVKESEPLSSEEWDNIFGNDWRPSQRDDQRHARALGAILFRRANASQPIVGRPGTISSDRHPGRRHYGGCGRRSRSNRTCPEQP